MARERCLALATCLSLLTAAPVLAAEAIRVEAQPGRVVGLDARGAERWSIAHPGLGEGKKKADTAVGPATLGRRAFYAIGSDLLEVDAARGRVVRRTRFPASIVALAARAEGHEPALLVTVATLAGMEPRDRMTMSFRPDGPRPGRGFWSYLGGAAARDARTLVAGYGGGNAQALAPTARDAAIAAFERAEAADPTNPFYPTYRGRLLAAAGRRDQAGRAFAAAADLPAASWSDLLSVSSALEVDDAREPARRAFARGFAGMKEAGIRPERVHTLLTPLVLLTPPRDKIGQLAAAGDVERYDEVVARLATVSPRAEWLDRAWETVAAWMRARGRDDLARKWDERAVIARTTLFANLRGLVDRLDPAIPFLLGAWFGVLGLALVSGFRGGIALGRRRAAGAVAGWRAWLPRPRAADLISLLAVLCAALVVSTLVAGWLTLLGTYAGTPIALLGDAAAAPAVERWLLARPASPARDRWLEYARQEARATRAGGKYVVAPPDDAVFKEMAETILLRERLRLGVTTAPDEVFIAAGAGPRTGILRILAVAVLLFGLGALAGAWLPRVARFAAWAVPGGPAPFSVLGGLVCGLTVAAALTLLGLDRLLRTIAGPSHSWIGLPMAPEPLSTPVWAWVVLALCLALHVAAAWQDARRTPPGGVTFGDGR